MSAGRWFVAPTVLNDPAHVILPAAVALQVRSVLRLRPGEHITLLDGGGRAAQLELLTVDREQVLGRVIAEAIVATEPRVYLTLAVGMLKATKFEWIIQKGTELGVSCFVPLLAERVTGGLGELSAAKLARWRTIATEAAEQSDRTVVPVVLAPLPFATALLSIAPTHPGLIAWEETAREQPGIGFNAALGSATYDQVDLFIGPEGGFSREEVRQAQAHGAQLVSLGPRILRAETAAIVAATLALAAMGELAPPTGRAAVTHEVAGR